MALAEEIPYFGGDTDSTSGGPLHRKPLIVAAILPAALAIVACGSSKSSSSAKHPAALNLSIADSGKTATFTAPSTVQGGLLQVSLKNAGTMPHSAQFVRVEDGHSTAEAYKIINSNSDKTPAWMRAAGGVSTTPPGQTNSATLDLPAGKYLLTEVGGPQSQAAPAQRELSVTGGTAGSLPGTSATVTASAPAKDKYKWQISGLHAGHNVVTFKSQGDEALHLIGAIRIKPGQNPSLSAIEKSFASNAPPGFADLTSYDSSAVLDGGKSQVTTLDLKPGTYVFFCPLTDRDGGKSHIAEGLLQKYTVK